MQIDLSAQEGRGGYKTSETLLGIETNLRQSRDDLSISYKTSETLLGIETDLKASEVASRAELQNL